jgi:hypothetical protein
MASRKQQRKAGRRAKKEQNPPKVPGRHPDGDRRRRGGMTYEQGLAQKRLMQQPMPDGVGEEE